MKDVHVCVDFRLKKGCYIFYSVHTHVQHWREHDYLCRKEYNNYYSNIVLVDFYKWGKQEYPGGNLLEQVLSGEKSKLNPHTYSHQIQTHPGLVKNANDVPF